MPSAHDNGDLAEEVAKKGSASTEQPDSELQNTYAAMSEEKDKLIDRIHEERLLWFIAFVIIFDSFVFMHMHNWGGPIAILILQVIAILVLSKRFGVEEIHDILNKVLYVSSRRKRSRKPKKQDMPGKTGGDSAKT